MAKTKIAVVGRGIAGCVTALHYHFYGDDKFEVEMYYDPEVPIEKVGQGTTISIANLVGNSLDVNWYRNNLGLTPKTGILYENWGQKHDKSFHEFNLAQSACHYVPKKFSEAVINSNLFKVTEKSVVDTDDEIDADYVFDCRGRSNIDYSEYDTIKNPLNAAILSSKEGRDHSLTYTRCVATPHGWTFVIPTTDSVSYGYLYNSNITTKEEATSNFSEMFDVEPLDHLSFNNYIAKNVWKSDKTILNGTKYSFIEPLEATSAEFYQHVARCAWDHIEFDAAKEYVNDSIRAESKRIENFILWHYKKGSKFDTPFWDYAKSYSIDFDDEFEEMLAFSRENSTSVVKRTPAIYSQWNRNCISHWDSI